MHLPIAIWVLIFDRCNCDFDFSRSTLVTRRMFDACCRLQFSHITMEDRRKERIEPSSVFHISQLMMSRDPEHAMFVEPFRDFSQYYRDFEFRLSYPQQRIALGLKSLHVLRNVKTLTFSNYLNDIQYPIEEMLLMLAQAPETNVATLRIMNCNFCGRIDTATVTKMKVGGGLDKIARLNLTNLACNENLNMLLEHGVMKSLQSLVFQNLSLDLIRWSTLDNIQELQLFQCGGMFNGTGGRPHHGLGEWKIKKL
jgi:hypothetical protein